MFGLVMTIGMLWKKRRLSIPWRRNHNVITLNQTLLFVILIYIDNGLLAYFLGTGGRFLFDLEMMRIIFIENLAFKFVFPLLLIWSSKSNLPALWSDREERRLDFFMTKPTFETRPEREEERRRGNVNVNRFITVTFYISNEINPTSPMARVE